MNDSYRLIEGMIKELMLEQAQPPRQPPPPAEPPLDPQVINSFMTDLKSISTFELTDKVGSEISNREYENLLFSALEGADYEQKIVNLQNILDRAGKEYYANDLVKDARECLAAMSFAKIALKLIYDTNYRRSGYAFETLMAVLMGGKREETYGPPTSKRSDKDFDIIDITSSSGKRYSAKFVSVSNMELKANFVNLYNEINKNGSVEYIYCVKKAVTQPKDQLRLEFNKIVIDKVLFDTVFRDLKKALSSDVSGNTTKIDQQLEAGYLRYNENMKNKFYSYIRANSNIFNADATNGSKLYGKDIPSSSRYDNEKEAIVTIVLKDISQLNPEKIATLNISTDNVRDLFQNNKNSLLNNYVNILNNLAVLTDATNRFVYGGKETPKVVVDSAVDLIDSVVYLVNPRSFI